MNKCFLYVIFHGKALLNFVGLFPYWRGGFQAAGSSWFGRAITSTSPQMMYEENIFVRNLV